MHILHITLHNFRSYRQQGELPHGCSPGTNTIVGRNGSGKSNWLQAVQFCLGLGPFAVLRQEERQAILHEGSGRAAVHAWVEVVLDNSQHRLAVQATTVTIRRTIGWKKDEFFLQRQRCTKQEITSLLEGAGFSKQNPYYIVQQGKVQALCTMSDLERLRLLQGVAGTVLYDEKKRDSVSHMHDNQGRLDQVNDLLQEMQDKLAELESEKEELHAYQQADRTRRALSYALYEKECHDARRQLMKIDQEREDHTETIQEIHHESRIIHDKIMNVETSIVPVAQASLKRWSQQVQTLRKQAAASKTALNTRKNKLAAAERSLQSQKAEEEKNKAQSMQLRESLKSAEHDLDVMQPTLKEARGALAALVQERTHLEETIQGLYAKQGRAQQYQTVAERDAFLQTQIQGIQQQLNSKSANIESIRQSLNTTKTNHEQEVKRESTVQNQLTQKSKHLIDLAKSFTKLQEQKVQLQTDRMKAWNQVSLAETNLRQAEKAWDNAQSLIRQSTPRATALGLQALPDLVRRLQLSDKQYFGTMLENFSLKDQKFQTAVEMAAQNALFHVIVDSDKTAAMLVKALEKEKSGRVTFLPLDQLRTDNHSTTAIDNVHPLLSMCLDYDPAVERAMKHVFGSKWIARTPELAAEVCHRHQVDVLTLEGDLCSRKGAMSGGYVDSGKSRIGAHNKSIEAKATLEKVRGEMEEANSAVSSLQEQFNACNQSVQRQTAQKGQLQHQKEQLHAQLQTCKAAQESLKSQSEQLSTSLDQDSKTLQTGQAELQRLQSELGSPLQTNLSEEDESLLSSSKERLETLVQNELQVAQQKASQITLQEQGQRFKIKQIAEQLQQLSGVKVSGMDDDEGNEVDEDDILDLQRALEDAEKVNEHNNAALKTAQESLAEAKAQWTEAKNELEHARGEDENIAKALEDANEKTEKLLTKVSIIFTGLVRLCCFCRVKILLRFFPFQRSMHMSKREAYTLKIQELGSLPPPSEIEKYKEKTIPELNKMIDSVNRKLKKYSHVNKKAFDQYVNFSEQRDSLLKRKEELDQGAAKVKDLIDSLDRKKDEAIDRTFRGVSQHFRDVFKELVPNGAGELIMRTTLDEEEDEPDEDSADSPKKAKAIESSMYRGISIKVRFSPVGENYLINQLSGGQKALTALALIFAIQRVDPAPFYLFDELDQALDSTYRAAVANVIKNQAAQGSQFLLTTFRPELVGIADRCFGVSLQNKVSNVYSFSKKEALKFVANLAAEEEKVGDITHQNTASRKRKAIAATVEEEGEEAA